MFRRGLYAFQKCYTRLNIASKHFPRATPSITLSSFRQSIILHKIPPQYEEYSRIHVLFGLSLMTLLGYDKSHNVEDDIVINIKKSIILMEREEYERAEQILHLTLRLAQQTQNAKAITYIYDVMANMALQRGEFEKAEKLFVSVMQRLLADGVAEGDIKNVHISLKLARIYHTRGANEKADMGFKWSLDHLKHAESDPEPNDDLLKILALGKDWYAHYLIDIKQYSEALTLLSESYDILIKYGDETLQETMLCLNDMANVHDMLENFDRAEELLIQATVLGKNMPKIECLGAIYINLGRLYLRKNLFEKARKSCGYGWRLCMDKKNKQCQEEGLDCLREVRKKE